MFDQKSFHTTLYGIIHATENWIKSDAKTNVSLDTYLLLTRLTNRKRFHLLSTLPSTRLSSLFDVAFATQEAHVLADLSLSFCMPSQRRILFVFLLSFTVVPGTCRPEHARKDRAHRRRSLQQGGRALSSARWRAAR